MTIIGLIQKTQDRRGYPLIAAKAEDGDVHPEMQIKLSVWQDALSGVPDDYLEEAWSAACQAHDWHRPFVPDFIADAYERITFEERIRREDLRRSKMRDDPNVCEHCHGFGYQSVWKFHEKTARWNSTVRPCCCEFAPAARRSERPLEPPEFVKGRKSGQWVKLSDLTRAGSVPTDAEDFVIM